MNRANFIGPSGIWILLLITNKVYDGGKYK